MDLLLEKLYHSLYSVFEDNLKSIDKRLFNLTEALFIVD